MFTIRTMSKRTPRMTDDRGLTTRMPTTRTTTSYNNNNKRKKYGLKI